MLQSFLKPPQEQFFRAAIICNKMPTHWSSKIFSALLNQSEMLALMAFVVTRNWFQSPALTVIVAEKTGRLNKNTNIQQHLQLW